MKRPVICRVVGTAAPAFTLVKNDLSEVSLSDFSGKKVVLNIFPSIDTPVCSASVKRFNEEASKLAGTVVLCISADLPFASGAILRRGRLEGCDPAVGVSFP